MYYFGAIGAVASLVWWLSRPEGEDVFGSWISWAALGSVVVASVIALVAIVLDQKLGPRDSANAE